MLSADFFQICFFFKRNVQKHNQSILNVLILHSVSPELGRNCFQMESADDKSLKERVKLNQVRSEADDTT